MNTRSNSGLYHGARTGEPSLRARRSQFNQNFAFAEARVNELNYLY